MPSINKIRYEGTEYDILDAKNRANIAAEYSASSTYAVGDMVLYEGQFYECSTAIATAEAWTAAHWTAVTVGGKIADLEAETSTLKEDFPQTKAAAYAAYATDTVQGEIASFPDGADNVPVKSLTVNIEPVQDLHGQNAPYPAGGGANQFDALTWGALGDNPRYYSVSNDETITVIANDGGGIGNRLIDIEANTTYSVLAIGFTEIKVFNSASSSVISRPSGTFTAPADGKIAIKVYASSYPTSGKIIFVKGSTIPTAWSPYENICPISGHTSAVVAVSPTTDAEDGTTVTINLGDTIYGGTLDVLTGVLTVDGQMVDLGTLNWSYNASVPSFYTHIGGMEQLENWRVVPHIVSDRYKTVYPDKVTSASLRENFAISTDPSGNKIFITDSRYTDASVFKTAMNGIIAVYKLAEPFTVQLTANDIKTILGTNNIWSDAGDVDVTYRADTKLYIDKRINEAVSALS